MNDYYELHESREYLLSDGKRPTVTCYVCGERGPQDECTLIEVNGREEWFCPDCKKHEEIKRERDERMAEVLFPIIDLWTWMHR